MKIMNLFKDCIASLPALIVLLILLTACTGGNYGEIRLSSEVNRLFESHQVLENHNYYYSGSNAIPNAIIGIHKDYTLRSELWKPVELTSDHLRQWINLMTDYKAYSFRTDGANILDPEGKIIGIWYSRYDETVVKILEDHQVIVYPPIVGPVDIKKGSLFFMDKD